MRLEKVTEKIKSRRKFLRQIMTTGINKVLIMFGKLAPWKGATNHGE
jgi:hypothetical protein